MNSHRPVRLAVMSAALAGGLALASCAGTGSPPPGTAPSPSVPVPSSPESTPGGGSTAAATSTFSGTWEDVQYAFDHPSDWTVQDTTAEAAPGSGEVSVIGRDGTRLASLSILIAWGAECPCQERPAVHLGDVPGKEPLSKSGPFVVRATAVDLTDFPQDRAENRWPDNVRVVTSLSMYTGPAVDTVVPHLMYGLGLVETGVMASNGITHRTVLFVSSRDFGTLPEARAYADSEEHRKIQEMIASFREGTVS